jgi:hypothetical protein
MSLNTYGFVITFTGQIQLIQESVGGIRRGNRYTVYDDIDYYRRRPAFHFIQRQRHSKCVNRLASILCQMNEKGSRRPPTNVFGTTRVYPSSLSIHDLRQEIEIARTICFGFDE